MTDAMRKTKIKSQQTLGMLNFLQTNLRTKHFILMKFKFRLMHTKLS